MKEPNVERHIAIDNLYAGLNPTKMPHGSFVSVFDQAWLTTSTQGCRGE